MSEQQKILRVFYLIKFLSTGKAKSIADLKEHLGVAKATVYRYITLLEEIGYNFDRPNGLYKIETYNDAQKFTTDEKKIISSLIKTIPKQNAKHSSILNKIKAFGNEFSPEALQNIKKIQLVDQLLFASEKRMHIILKNYKSTNAISNDRDRNVVALEFNEDNMSLLTYDLESSDIKIYKVSRIPAIDYPEEKIHFTLPKTLPSLDKFGWSGTKKLKIELLLTSRAASLLIETFPSTESNISMTKSNPFEYRYKDHVYGYQGIGRFVLGLCTEIKIVGDDGLKEYVKEKIEKSTLGV
jgi:proteasome accessory factor C